MRGLASTLGLVALFAAVVVGALAAFGGFGAQAPQESASPVGLEATTEATAPQAGQAAVAVGQTVRAGDVAWTVTDASPETELSRFTFPPQTISGNYVTLTFTVENISERPVTLTEDEIVLFDASGIEYRPEPDRNDPYIQPERNLLFTEHGLLKPGDRKEGEVNFEVLSRSSGFTALLGDTDPTFNEGRYVDLGF